jgi:hypothetical protein
VAFRRRKAPVVNDDPVADEPVAEPDLTLALEEARRGFDSLEKHLADIRNRSQQIVGIGALAASIVGGPAALGPDKKLGVWGIVALGVFAVIVIICLCIWWPRKLWVSQDPAILVTWRRCLAKRGSEWSAIWLYIWPISTSKTQTRSRGC